MKTIEDFIRKKDRRSKGIRLDRKKIQTGNPKNTYKRGDSHPFIEGLFYRQWYKEKEVWITEDSLEKVRNDQRKRSQKPSNKELKRKLDRDYYERNKNAIQKNVAKWKAENPGKVRLYGRKARSIRRAFEVKALIELTDTQKTLISHFYNHAKHLSDKTGIKFEVDHIIPLSKGGFHCPLNLQVVPMSWNRKKHNRSSERWLPNGF